MELAELMFKSEEDIKPRIKYPICISRTEGRGKNAKKVFHNFMNGKDYETMENIADECGDCVVIVKQNNTKDSVINYNGHKIAVRNTTKSSLEEVAYDIVEINGQKFLAIFVCDFDIRTTLSSPDEIREWVVRSRCYLDNNKNCYPSSSWTWRWRYIATYEKISYNDAAASIAWWNMYNINDLERNWNSDENIFDVFNHFGWGVVIIGTNELRKINCGYTVHEFLKYKEPLPKDGPKQKKIDELVKYELENVVVPKWKNPGKNLKSWERDIFMREQDFANVSMVKGYNGDICCYRTFYRNSKDSYYEGARIYIEKNGKFTACKRTNIGNWVNVVLSGRNSNFAYKLSYVNKDAVKGTVLEYLVPMLDDVKTKGISGSLIAASLRKPCIEKLYKSDLKEMIDSCIKNNYCNIWESLTDYLGPLNENGKTLYAILGINKKQYEIILNELKDIPDGYHEKKPFMFLGQIKECLGRTNISDIDIETFSEMVAFIKFIYLTVDNEVNEGVIDSKGIVHKLQGYDCGNRKKHAFEAISIIANCFPLSTLKSMIPKVKELWLTFVEGTELRWVWNSTNRGRTEVPCIKRPIGMYVDYLTMLQQLPTRQGLTCHFQSLGHIKIMHDDILPVHRYYQELRWAEQRDADIAKKNEKWNTLKKGWEKYLYEDENYSVIYPEEPYSLTIEGTALGHCVGGYINKVLSKSTNILFIRKKDALDKPFFTVELGCNGAIEQVHGMRNCCVSSPEVLKDEPDLGMFIANWAKEKKLILTNYNKVR